MQSEASQEGVSSKDAASPGAEPAQTGSIPAEETAQQEGDTEDQDQNFDLDAEQLIRLFAGTGVICGVLEPKEPGATGEILPESLPAAKRADALILDWRIHESNGDYALSLVKQVLKEDQRHDSRLRLILIYTAEPGLKEVFNRLKATLVEESGNGSISANEHKLVLTGSALRIAVLAKPSPLLKQEWRNKAVPIQDLPARLVSEFAELTSGLVSNVALQSLSVLRNQTHTLLAHMGRELDAAYVTHRLLLPTPDDAIEHATDLVIGECASLLHSFEVGRVSDANAVRAWVAQRDSYSLQLVKETKEVPVQLVANLTSHGIDAQEDELRKLIPKTNIESFHLFSTSMLVLDRNRAEEIDHLFTVATSLVRRYEETQPAPWLRLGSILKVKRSNPPEGSGQPTPIERYLICIHPPCDCVRLCGRARAFMFLPAEVKDKGRFDYVVVDGKDFRKLQMQLTVPEMHSFDPGPNEDLVRGKPDGSEYVFPSGEQNFIWIGQLKEMYAQRLVNQFAANFSRVALNEYEWARRMNKK
jgi:hypothetical protein